LPVSVPSQDGATKRAAAITERHEAFGAVLGRLLLRGWMEAESLDLKLESSFSQKRDLRVI
jgi:hypothetical protein